MASSQTANASHHASRAGVTEKPMSEAVDALVFQIRAVGLPAPVREHKFPSPTARWRFDLAWPDRHVAVEVDGGVWTGGRHVTGSGATKDAEKFSNAAALGWRVLARHARAGRQRQGRLLARASTGTPTVA